MSTLFEKVFIVDDDPSINFLHRIIIEDSKIAEKIVEFTNGKHLVDYLKTTKDNIPNLILLDLNMPVMNGWEVLEYLEEENFIQKNNACKIFVLSASQNPADFEKSKQFSIVSEFLNKPLDADKLKICLAS